LASRVHGLTTRKHGLVMKETCSQIDLTTRPSLWTRKNPAHRVTHLAFPTHPFKPTKSFPCHRATSRIHYMVSLEPLNLFLSRFILDVPLFHWEVVTGRKERGSFDLLSTTLPSNQFLGLRALTNGISFYPGPYLFNVAIGNALASGQQRSR
jgi:hypothetical protein